MHIIRALRFVKLTSIILLKSLQIWMATDFLDFTLGKGEAVLVRHFVRMSIGGIRISPKRNSKLTLCRQRLRRLQTLVKESICGYSLLSCRIRVMTGRPAHSPRDQKQRKILRPI